MLNNLNKMKFGSIVFFALIFSSFTAQTVVGESITSSDLNAKSVMQGRGEHRYVSLQNWNGNSEIVSRLEKNNQIFLLERISKNEFVVKDEKTNQEYVRLIDENPWILKPKDGISLVDIRIEKECVTTLFSCPNDCIWVRSRPSNYSLKSPLHWLPPLSPSTKDWKIESAMYLRPLFKNNSSLMPGTDPAGLVEICLNADNDIEFVFEDKTKDVYAFKYFPAEVNTNANRFKAYCEKNEKPYTLNGGALCLVRGIITESEHLKEFKEKTTDDVKVFLKFFFTNKNEAIQWYGNNFQDKQAAEEIIGIISKAYSNESEK